MPRVQSEMTPPTFKPGAILAFVAAAAGAMGQEAPHERYTVYQTVSTTYTYLGYFVLKDGGRYEWGFGKGKATGRGTYAAQGGRVAFKSGPLKNLGGTYSLKPKGRHFIEMRVPSSKPGKTVRWYCNCDPHSK